MANAPKTSSNARITQEMELLAYLPLFEYASSLQVASYQWVRNRIENEGGPTVDRKAIYDFSKKHVPSYIESRKKFRRSTRRKQRAVLTKTKFVGR